MMNSLFLLSLCEDKTKSNRFYIILVREIEWQDIYEKSSFWAKSYYSM